MKKPIFRLLILMISLCFVLPIFVACGHDHPFIADWTKDETHHYHLCECGEQMDIGKHQYDEGKVHAQPTCVTYGLKVYTCVICGYEKPEIITTLDHLYQPAFDDENHFQQCVGCGKKINISAHRLDLTITTLTHKGECGCGYIRAEENHNHQLDPKTGKELCTVCGHEKGVIILPEV